MREIIVSEGQCGIRLNKFLMKYMSKAPQGFVYKMLRKKNITLNGTKASGAEILSKGDCISLYLSDDTIAKFSQGVCVNDEAGGISVIYEDGHVLICDKPAGILTHGGSAGDGDTIAQRLLLYLRNTGKLDTSANAVFTPAPVNRLDYNTSGVLVCAKTLVASQWLSAAFSMRKAVKEYEAIVLGEVMRPGRLLGIYDKNEALNKANICLVDDAEYCRAAMEGKKVAETLYAPVWQVKGYSRINVVPVTGRSHQIRVHMAEAGYPLVGDMKYGDQDVNKRFVRAAGVESQLLYARSITFTEETGELGYLCGKTFTTAAPLTFYRAETFIKSMPYN